MRGRGWLIALAASAVLLVPAVTAGAQTPTYPDLRMRTPATLLFGTSPVNGVPHYVLSFDTRMWNAGPGPLELHRTPNSSGTAELTQRVYEAPAGFRDEPLGTVAFDVVGPPVRPSGFPIPNIARYEVWAERDYRRALNSGFTRGQPMYWNHRAHCLSDDEAYKPDASPTAVYTCSVLVNGLSVGWSHVENGFGVGQWIDFGTSPPPDDDYVLRVIADPLNLVHESEGKSDPSREGAPASSGTTRFSVLKGKVVGIT